MKIETNFKIDTDDGHALYRQLYIKLLEQAYRCKLSLLSRQPPADEEKAAEEPAVNPSPD